MTAIEAGVKDLKLRRDCVLMCEPGRGLVAHAISIVAQVQLRKGNQLYINDGIYGSFDEMVVAEDPPAGPHGAPRRGFHGRRSSPSS